MSLKVYVYNLNIKTKQGFTFIELLIIMSMLSILFAYGTQFVGSALVGADRKVSIIEMRNIANALEVIDNASPSIKQSGILAELNALQTLIQFPQQNRFDENYHYTLTPTIKVSSTIRQRTHPLGFLAENVTANNNKTILTVNHRAKIHQKKSARLAWVKQFYYNNNASLTLRQTNGAGFTASNILGVFAP